jgi:uncharacterized membrane protein
MNRVLAVVFDDLSQALDGREALKNLDRDESITLYEYAIVIRKIDGTIGVSEEHKHPFPHRTLAGTSIKSLIGLLNRPGGVPADNDPSSAEKVKIAADFVNEVSRALAPGKIGLLADIDEEWTPWIDLRMQELGGTVYRCPFADVKEAANVGEIAAMQADLARLRAEHARGSADRKAKLYDKINALDTKIQQQLERAKKHREVAAADARKKADVLEMEAAQEKGGNRNARKVS